LTIFHDEAISYEGCTGFGIGAQSFFVHLRDFKRSANASNSSDAYIAFACNLATLPERLESGNVRGNRLDKLDQAR